MQRVVLADKKFDAVILKAKKVLDDGGVIAYPTDTCYGLGARADNSQAIERIKKFKGRKED